MDLATAPRSIYPLVPLKLTDFRYEFPRELVAKYPAEPRDAARMMVIHREEGRLEHRTFADLPEYFGEGDALVTNDTQVFPARLYGRKEGNGAKVEVFLLRELNATEGLWDVLVEPARKIRVGNKLFFGDHLAAEVIDNTTSRGRTVRFMYEGTPEDFYGLVDEIGVTPIPPYLRRDEEPEDADRYQTIFAKQRGAVAAPTAGLHFTPELVERIEAQGASVCTVTLHTGLGSFQPVEVEDLGKHRMDLEYFEVPEEACGPVNHALSTRGCTVTACGTTVVRAMESSLSAMKQLKADSGWTDKFIYPPHDFLIADRLITNFHRPCSTLLMMISAFAGHELVQHAYQEAIKEEYRLFSFGDGMLIV